MNRKGDLRITRTERHLKEALFSLLEEKPADRITVRELADRAEISRATFYLYYDSIPSMIEAIETDIMAEYEEHIREIASESSHFEEFIIRAVRFNFENTSSYLTFAKLIYLGTIGKNNVDTCIGIITREVVRLFQNPDDAAQFRYFLLFELNGVISIMRKWILEDSDHLSAGEMSDLVVDMILHNTEHYQKLVATTKQPKRR